MRRRLLLLPCLLAGGALLLQHSLPADDATTPNPLQASISSLAPDGVEQIPAGVEGHHVGSPIKIAPGEKLKTVETFHPPIEITIVAKTDSTNLRIGYAAKQVIFNWEQDQLQLRIDGGPNDGDHQPGKGAIPSGEYVTVRWVVTKTDQSIYVDGDLRYKGTGDFSTVNKPITIFGGHGSIVTVQSLITKQMN